MESSTSQEKSLVLDKIEEDICSQFKNLPADKKLVYIGRFCPMHLGHQAMIGGVYKTAPNNHMILIGSCNQPTSYRNLFDFKDRLEIIKTIYPDLTIAGLPDFKGDNDSWFANLDCMIATTGTHPKDVVFVGGCEEDITWFKVANRATFLVNRFSGVTLNVSGTEIRDHLITGHYDRLAGLLDNRIIPTVIDKFKTQWAKLRQQ